MTSTYDSLASANEIIAEIRAGRMVVLVDDPGRENEGDLVLAADFATPEAINFMATHGRGLICLTLTQAHCQKLHLPLMVSHNNTHHGTNFTVSIEAAQGITTGISAHDRAQTICTAVADDAKPGDIVQPGHVFPLMAAEGGVLMRAGHTEAGCDLARLAGCTPAAVICEIMKDDGSMARMPDLLEFAKAHGLKVGTIADLIHHRARSESLIERVATRTVQTVAGPMQSYAYREKNSHEAHMALAQGTILAERMTHVRVHEPLSVMDLLDTQVSTHTWTIHQALHALCQAPAGVLVLLNMTEQAGKFFKQFEVLKALDETPYQK